MRATTASGKTIHYMETGSGAPMLFVHGSFAKASAWRGVIEGLADEPIRCIALDLMGCGETDAPAQDGTLLGQDIDAVIAVASAASDAPVHLVGHSYGGIVALGAALAGRIDLASLTLFEPLPLAFLAETGDDAAIEEMAAFIQDYKSAFEAGEQWAFSRVITLWGGPGAFEAMPMKVRDMMDKGTADNLRQWRDNFAFTPSADAYRALDVQAQLVVGEHAHPVCRLISQRLSELMPNAALHTMTGANHFMIHSHAGDCAALLSNR